MNNTPTLSQQKKILTTSVEAKDLIQAKAHLEQYDVPADADVEYWRLVSVVHHGLQDIDSAVSAYQNIVSLIPENANAHSDLGYLYQLQQQVEKAYSCFEKALNLDKNNLNATFNLARLHTSQGDFAGAEKLYRQLIQIRPEFVDSYINLGNVLKEQGRKDEALASYKDALNYDANSFLAHANLAIVLEQTHSLEDALKHGEAAYLINSGSHAVLLSLATINKRLGNDDKCLQLLNQSVSLASSPIEQASSYSKLGRAYEALERFSDAFSSFDNANQACKSMGVVDTAAYIDNIDANSKIIDDLALLESQSDGVLQPVFLVGFPRSGTTLTEQILTSHEKIIASKEHPIIPQIVSSISTLLGKEVVYPECVSSLSDDQLVTLREKYWEIAKGLVGESLVGNRFIDKLPLNIVELNFIHRLFPEANIIVLIRDPRDVCLSCFTHSFVLNQAMVHFLDLESTVSLYNDCMSLWLKYRSKLPLNYLEVRYEDLVDDMQSVTREILEFLGEEWSDSVMSDFDVAKDPYIKTPGYEGVSKPIYSTSIGKWKRYESQLGPIIPKLKVMLTEFSYTEK